MLDGCHGSTSTPQPHTHTHTYTHTHGTPAGDGLITCGPLAGACPSGKTCSPDGTKCVGSGEGEDICPRMAACTPGKVCGVVRTLAAASWQEWHAHAAADINA